MRHGDKNKKMGRDRKGRTALKRSLLSSLFIRERIKTTEAKAKAIRPIAEKLVTVAKKGTLASRRSIASTLMNDIVLTDKMMKEIAKRFEERNGGYTRIIKLPPRKSDGSKMAIIELV